MKTKLLLIILVGLIGHSQTIYAQSPEWLWAKSAGGAADDVGYSIATDADGNVVVTGDFKSPTITFGSITLVNGGGSDVFVVKYDPSGNVLWAKSAGDFAFDHGTSISTDASGNIIVTGFYASPTLTFGNFTITRTGGNDMFIVKYDPSGNVLWAKSEGGITQLIPYGICTDADENILVTGDFNGDSLFFGPFLLTGPSSIPLFVVKYDPSGNVLWANSAGGDSPDRAYSIATDDSGNVFVAGSFRSPTITFGSTTLTNVGLGDNFIVKYDPAGSVMWAKSQGSPSEDVGYSIATDQNGNILVSGFFITDPITFGSTTLLNEGSTDIYIVKYDTSGDVLWAKSAGGVSSDTPYGISTDASGNVLLTGYFGAFSITFGTTTLQHSGSGDIFVAKFDDSGNVLWAKSVGGPATEYGTGISTDANGNIFITGAFISPSLPFGTTTLTNQGISDIFVAKLDAVPLGITENSNNGSVLNYPNPFNSFTTIQLKMPISNGQLSIYNVNGKLVKEIRNISGQRFTYHRENLESGLYFMRLTEDDKVIASQELIIID